MFKKPFSDLKTSAPLRSSDRRKLKQRVIDVYSLSPEVGELLVPDGLLSQKFSTHVEEHGVAYISQAGDPLWFTVGKGSDELIPTVYTLWKHPVLLPLLSTPSAVIPKLIGGADLMIPGVIQHTPILQPNQLVSITQYHPPLSTNDVPVPRIGPPLAVGHMAVSSGGLKAGGEERKGKAVLVAHTWKDCLWDMGSGKKGEVPVPREVNVSEAVLDEIEDDSDGDRDEDEDKGGPEGVTNPEGNDTGPTMTATTPIVTDSGDPQIAPEPAPSKAVLTPEDVSSVLRSALLQALTSTLNSLPPSAFPIPASTFWTTHVLPARPVHALGENGLADASAIEIKHSTYKSVKVFLKACAKEGLIKLKENKNDIFITGVFPGHPSVSGHRSHKTLASVEAKHAKTEERERKEKEAEERKKGEIQISELWKPYGTTIGLFVTAGKSSQELYTLAEIRDVFNTYIVEKQLINAREQQYINVGQDDALSSATSIKNEERPEFLKREDALKRVRDNMQSWHRVEMEGEDVVTKKGPVKPVSVLVKIRQGRKAATLVTGFEMFSLKADDLAEELRKLCASSTSVTPLPGKASSDMEVMVQGKQIKSVTDYLVSKGVPKKWIESADLSAAKKKK